MEGNDIPNDNLKVKILSDKQFKTHIRNKLAELQNKQRDALYRKREISVKLENCEKNIQFRTGMLQILEKNLESLMMKSGDQVEKIRWSLLIIKQKDEINTIEKNKSEIQIEQKSNSSFLNSIKEEMHALIKQVEEQQSRLFKKENNDSNEEIIKEKKLIKQNFPLKKIEKAQSTLKVEAKSADDIKLKIQGILKKQQELDDRLIEIDKVIQSGLRKEARLKKEYADIKKEQSDVKKSLKQLLKKQESNIDKLIKHYGKKFVDQWRKAPDISKIKKNTNDVKEMSGMLNDLNLKLRDIEENQVILNRSISLVKEDKNDILLQQDKLTKEFFLKSKVLEHKELHSLIRQNYVVLRDEKNLGENNNVGNSVELMNPLLQPRTELLEHTKSRLNDALSKRRFVKPTFSLSSFFKKSPFKKSSYLGSSLGVKKEGNFFNASSSQISEEHVSVSEKLEKLKEAPDETIGNDAIKGLLLPFAKSQLERIGKKSDTRQKSEIVEESSESSGTKSLYNGKKGLGLKVKIHKSREHLSSNNEKDQCYSSRIVRSRNSNDDKGKGS